MYLTLLNILYPTRLPLIDAAILATVTMLCTIYPIAGIIQSSKYQIDKHAAIASAASVLLVVATNESNQGIVGYTFSLLAAMSLAFYSVFIRSQNRAVGIVLYLLRIAKLALSIRQNPPALTMLIEVLLCLFVVWSHHLSGFEKGTVKHFLSGAFGIRMYFFLRKYFQHGASLDDIHGPEMTPEELDKIIDADQAASKKGHSVVYTLLFMHWKELAFFSAIELTVNLVKLWRSMIFVSILAAIEVGRDKENVWNVVSLTVVWLLLSVAIPINRHSSLQRDNLRNRICMAAERLVAQRQLFNTTKDPSEMWSVWNRTAIFVDYFQTIVTVVTSCIPVLASMWIVTGKIGWRVVIPLVIGLVYSVLSQTVNRHIGYLCKLDQRGQMHTFKDLFYLLRQNIRAIKFYAWEDVFLGVKEYSDFKEFVPPLFWRLANHILDFVGNATSEISAAVTISSYLTATRTLKYSELSLIIESVGSTTSFVLGFACIRQSIYDLQKSANHLEHMFAEDESSYIERKENASEKMSVVLEDAVFSWGSDKYSLKPTSMQVQFGDFVTVVGRIGSGKSSLLSAIVGEMPLVGGHGCIYGSIGYVDQKPWIMDGTFRENVLMTSNYDAQWFQKVVDACALTADLEQMPEGDMTVIGFGGINLSGGQKVRLALARAIYRKADVYILDDVLAAVDSQTERHIVERVLLGDGIISKNTRILVTHAMHVVPFSNTVVTMENGQASVVHQIPAALDKYKINNNNSLSVVTSSEESNSKYGTNSYEIKPELDAKQNQWECLSNLLRLSSYSVVAIVILFQAANAYALYYVNSLRLGLMSEISVDTLHLLRQYLLVNVVVQVGRQQLTKAERWLQKTMWFKKLSESMRLNILIAVLSTPVPISERMSALSLENLFHADRFRISNMLPNHLSNTILSNTFSVVTAVLQAAKSSPILILACLPVVGLRLGLRYIYDKIRKKYSTIRNKSIWHHQSKIEECINKGGSLIRIHGLGKNYLRLLSQNLGALMHANTVISEVSESKSLILTAIGELLKTCILIFKLWQHFFTARTVTPGEIEAEMKIFLHLVDRTAVFLNNLTIPELYMEAMAKYHVYTETIEREKPRIIGGNRPASNWPSQGAIEFKNYCMRYRSELDTVINNLSFSVRGSEKIGIVGRTGAGKSSLSFALMRLVEADSGQILIDGVDISTIGLHDLRTRISIIPQDPALMTGTIRMNLDPLDQYTDEEVWAAIRAAHISDLMEVPTDKYVEVPWEDVWFYDNKGPWLEGTGLQKWVEDGGKNFSVGQRQLVCLCRALLWKRKVLILDEATANVDPKTDEIMQSVVREMFKDCTVLTIAHRLDTVMDSDRILVMDGGRAVEFDTPANLLAQDKDGYFAKLVESMKLNQNI